MLGIAFEQLRHRWTRLRARGAAGTATSEWVVLVGIGISIALVVGAIIMAAAETAANNIDFG